MKRIKAEYRYDKTEIRWIVIDPKANPILAKTMKLTGATRWHKITL